MAHGRASDAAQLLPVTKTVDADTTAHLYSLGERDFAENRADALAAKSEELAHRGMRPRWHFIGPLQRNKARRVVRCAAVLHSVHSLALIEALQRIALEEGRELDLYLQVHTSGDANKQGFEPDRVAEAALAVQRSSQLRCLGLMAMGPLVDPDGLGTVRAFQACRDLGADLLTHRDLLLPGGICQLSMGMSGDLGPAIANGSTLVRVGSALFL